MEIMVKTVIEWRLDVACQALEEALQNEEAVERYLKLRDLEIKTEIHLEDIGWTHHA